MRRNILLKLFIFLSVMILSGCRIIPLPVLNDNKTRQILVGFSMATLKEERWQRDLDTFSARIKGLGARIIVQHANNDPALQVMQIEYLIKRRVDVLVIVPQDSEETAPIVQKAKKAGIKVVTYDRLIRNVKYDLYVSFDSIRSGELMAEQLIRRSPNGRYVIINGAPTDNNCFLLNKGYKKILNSPLGMDVKVLAETWADDWRPEHAYKFIDGLLRSGTQFEAVIAANDGLASASIEALSEWRLAGKVLVTGHDADLSACQRIVEGTQTMTVYKPIRELATRAADLTIALAKGEEIYVKSSIFNGKYHIPAEIIEPIGIDSSNITVVIKDGFHDLEKVFMHVPRSEWPTIE
jgi:D-xylose transport system substrate-binding protein